MAAQGWTGNGDAGVDGNSVKSLNDSDKWHKALPHLFLKNCCLPREESFQNFSAPVLAEMHCCKRLSTLRAV